MRRNIGDPVTDRPELGVSREVGKVFWERFYCTSTVHNRAKVRVNGWMLEGKLSPLYYCLFACVLLT